MAKKSKKRAKTNLETYCCRCRVRIAMPNGSYCGSCDEVEEEIFKQAIEPGGVWDH